MIYFRFLDIPAYFIAYIIISFFGLCIGSFLNVCIYRLPLENPAERSLVKRCSHCPKCGAKIRFYDNVPVFSWLILKGKCRNCKEPISKRYPLVESLNWFLYMLALTFIDVQNYPVHSILIALFFSVLIVIGFIDYDTMEIYPSQLGLIVILAVLDVIFGHTITIPQRIIGALAISVPFFIIGEVSGDVLNKIHVVLLPFIVDVIERFNRNAVLVLKQGVEHGSVGIATRMTHYENLIGCRFYEVKQIAVIMRFQVFDGFYVA